MGTNRRYADHVDRQMDERVLERIARSGALQTLSDLELQLDAELFTRDPRPRPVTAWVRFGETPVQVRADACAWTPHAVGIRFAIGGREYKTWVWASAVRAADQGRRPTTAT